MRIVLLLLFFTGSGGKHCARGLSRGVPLGTESTSSRSEGEPCDEVLLSDCEPPPVLCPAVLR